MQMMLTRMFAIATQNNLSVYLKKIYKFFD